MNRAQFRTLVFALVAAAFTMTTAVVAYRGMRSAFERESAQRLQQLAELAASQLAPSDLLDIRDTGPEGTGLLAVQAQLDALCAATGLANAAVLDDSGHVLYDVRAGIAEPGAPSAYDSLGHAALAAARRGGTHALPAFRRDGREVRAAAAPVPAAAGAVLVTETYPAWGGELARLRRDLMALALVSVLAVALLAALVMRANTAQLVLERRLSQSENLAAMGRMTATLAHEIKNPLAIIRGSARRLGKLEPEAQRMADSVVEEVDRLSATVNRYLQFARGGGAVAGGHGDATAALAATLDLVEGEFRSRGVALVREGDWAATPVALDDASLKQVWLNLVQNALEAAPERGHVWVTCARSESRAEVRVRDNGPGIPAEVMARLGEPFLTTRAQGTGLGLHLSRQLAEGAGGRLRAECPPGGGTTVIVELPLADNRGDAAPRG